MSDTSTIRDFQTVLSSFSFSKATSFSESFAIARFKKKFEVPNSNAVTQLSSDCWDNWLEFDNGLREIYLPNGAWYKVRELLHRELMPVRFNQIHFPKGTEFDPTRGQNSIEARLCQSRWTCTVDNFDHMARVCYSHKALKRAVRNRYASWYAKRGFDISQSTADKLLYSRFSRYKGDVGFHIFSWKLRQFCVITHGSRFSTVPKNNENRRPINIEPFGNIITQRAVGTHLRSEIARIFSIDLDDLASVHRERIKYVQDIATIDLKNASDSVSRSLCKFLLPKSIFNAIDSTRSHMVLGPDGEYHITKKISSMGNGFTFELMSLILNALCRVYDPSSSVFGDDIIIQREHARQLIDDLESVGFVVNEDKSFIDGPFRESCGANYHVDEGYIESYDFKYPESIGDCVVIWNKIVRLAPLYPSFKALHDSLYRSLPHALRGGPNFEFEQRDMLTLLVSGPWDSDVVVDFPQFFVTKKIGGSPLNEDLQRRLQLLHYDPDDFRLVRGFKFVSDLRSKTLKHLGSSLWAKYEMYLFAGRRSDDVLSNRGKWVSVWFVNSECRSFRASLLMI